MNIKVVESFTDKYNRGKRDPVYFVKEFIGITSHPGQKEWLRELIARERALACGNRWGKSFVSAARLVWRAFYQIREPRFKLNEKGKINDYYCVNICHSLDQSKIVWDYALKMVVESPILSPLLLDAPKHNPFPEFKLGSNIKGNEAISYVWARSTARKAQYLLGHNYNFINWDEIAFDPDAEDIYGRVIQARLFDQLGDLDMISSPNGKNFFYKKYLQGQDKSNTRVYSRNASTFENPHIDKQELLRMKDEMSESYYNANILGQFVDTSNIFPYDKLVACQQDYQIPVPADCDYNVPPNPEEARKLKYYQSFIPSSEEGTYVMGVDFARHEGNKGDHTCIIILRIDRDPMQLVVFQLLGDLDWEAQKTRISNLHDEYHCSYAKYDKTGAGGPVVEDLLKPNLYNLTGEGINFTGAKEGLLQEGREAIQKRRVVFPYIKELMNQLLYYQNEKSIEKNLSTDAVFGLCLAISAANKVLGRSRLQMQPTIVLPVYNNQVYTMDEDDSEIWIPFDTYVRNV